MGVTPSRSRAWRWVRVVVARTAMRRSRPRRTTLRVSVARSPSRVWKLCTGSGSSSAGSVRVRAALRCAAGEGSAVATGEVRCASRAAGSGSSNSIGARLQMLRHVADQLRQKWPKLAAFIDDSETDGLSYLDFPEQHRSKLHSTDEIDKHFSARLPAGFGIGGALGRAMQPFLSVEGTVAKRAARMRLCQRRQPPKAVAAGQRLQSRILAATIARGARGAALFKGKVAGSRHACSGRNFVRVVSSGFPGGLVSKSKAGG